MNKLERVLLGIVAVIAAVALGVSLYQPAEPIARSYNTNVYTEQGGSKMIVASGGELEVQSGATLDIQSGATTDFSGGVDLDGASLVIDADGDTSLISSVDDVITVTLGAATGDMIIDVGNLQVGYGSPGQTLDGDDFYVKGLAEIDGVAYLDGGADLNGTTLTVDADADTTIVSSVDDVITITMGAAAGDVVIDVGNLQVGYGSPDQTLDGDDLYVEGQAEVDGSAWFDGIVDIGGLLKLSFNDRATSDGDTITPTFTIYSLDTSGAVTITLAASADEGQLLILCNDDAHATIINDTNLASSDGGTITLAGADDWVMFIYQDAKWHEIAKSANS